MRSYFKRERKVIAKGIFSTAVNAENIAKADMPIDKAAELNKPLMLFNMEWRFAKIKEIEK